MSLPDVLTRRLVGHPALEIAAVGVATHPHALRAGREVEHEAIAVVLHDAMRKRPAHAAAVHAAKLDDVAGAHPSPSLGCAVNAR